MLSVLDPGVRPSPQKRNRMSTINGTINGVDLDALNDTIEAVTNQRDLARVTFSVDGAWEGGFRLAAATGSLVQAGQADGSRSGRFEMSSDEPLALLGSDTAASPAEYVLQALAGCYTVT